MSVISTNGKATTSSSIELADDGVLIRDWVVDSAIVNQYLRQRPIETWPQELKAAIEIGVMSMERAATSLDIDLLQQRLDGVLHGVETSLLRLPGQLEERLTKQDGGLVAPLRVSIDDAARQAAERTKEVRELFEQELDPKRDSSTIGLALRGLSELLDPNRKDSVHGVLAEAVADVTAADGNLSKRVATVVSEIVKPLRDQVERLTLEVRGIEAASEALAETPAKGHVFEDEIVESCHAWAAASGSVVEHVGPDNKPGDILLDLSSEATGEGFHRIIIECRDRRGSRKGRTAVSRDIDRAMAHRTAQAGIYLNRTADGFGADLGDWGEGDGEHGPWVATTPEHLVTAIRFLIVKRSLAARRAAAADVDQRTIEEQLARIRTALDRITQINREAGLVRGSANRIQEHADDLRNEIRGALCKAEDALRTAGSEPEGQSCRP